jgi:hypothetical protein
MYAILLQMDSAIKMIFIHGCSKGSKFSTQSQRKEWKSMANNGCGVGTGTVYC